MGRVDCRGGNVRKENSDSGMNNGRAAFSQTRIVSTTMDLLNNPSDDQIAAIGCVLAFVLSGGLMYVSFFLRSTEQKTEHTAPVPFESAQSDTTSGKNRTSKAA